MRVTVVFTVVQVATINNALLLILLVLLPENKQKYHGSYMDYQTAENH